MDKSSTVDVRIHFVVTPGKRQFKEQLHQLVPPVKTVYKTSLRLIFCFM